MRHYSKARSSDTEALAARIDCHDPICALVDASDEALLLAHNLESQKLDVESLGILYYSSATVVLPWPPVSAEVDPCTRR